MQAVMDALHPHRRPRVDNNTSILQRALTVISRPPWQNTTTTATPDNNTPSQAVLSPGQRRGSPLLLAAAAAAGGKGPGSIVAALSGSGSKGHGYGCDMVGGLGRVQLSAVQQLMVRGLLQEQGLGVEALVAQVSIKCMLYVCLFVISVGISYTSNYQYHGNHQYHELVQAQVAATA